MWRGRKGIGTLCAHTPTRLSMIFLMSVFCLPSHRLLVSVLLLSSIIYDSCTSLRFPARSVASFRIYPRLVVTSPPNNYVFYVLPIPYRVHITRQGIGGCSGRARCSLVFVFRYESRRAQHHFGRSPSWISCYVSRVLLCRL
ncbi:hypothetical protein BD309DRAFT_661404 [Dichomitus squalens]|nr:hypothetical protein BD309DRAFT_661404 [Dichomitus squalens]